MRDPSDLPENDRPTGERHAPPGTGMGQPGSANPASAEPASGQPTLTRLKRRADFLHAAKGKRWHGKALSLHAAPARPTRGADPRECVPGGGAPREGAPAVARVGFTLTKKVGNAVVRNRARRRLREAIRSAGDLPAQAGYDYVVIGRIDAVRVPFTALRREIVRAVGDVHGARSGRGTRASGPRPQDLSPQDEPSPRKPNASKPDAAKPNAAKPRTIRP